jgi:thiamine-monophosphate kinase
MNQQKRTEISELGEFGLIEKLTSTFKSQHKHTVKGPGDDAAVIDVGEQYMLLSTDMLIEGIHFDLGFTPLKHLGFKAISVNVSDIAAMNGIPAQVTVSLGLSNRFSVEALGELYEGIQLACTHFKVDLAGGDTCASPSGLIISVAVTGFVDKDKIAYRSGAKESDIICVTGDLGAAFMGLTVLSREKETYKGNPDHKPDLENFSYLVGRQLRPEARMDIIYELADLNVVPTSMIDVSDGLASELYHLCKHSNVGVAVYEDKLPMDAKMYETAVEFNIDPITAAMNGGEDYELLFTIAQTDFEKLKNQPDIHFIGYTHAAEKGKVLVTKNGNSIGIQAQGWKHF